MQMSGRDSQSVAVHDLLYRNRGSKLQGVNVEDIKTQIMRQNSSQKFQMFNSSMGHESGMSIRMKPPLYQGVSKVSNHLPDLSNEQIVEYDRSQAASRGNLNSRGRKNLVSQLGVYENNQYAGGAGILPVSSTKQLLINQRKNCQSQMDTAEHHNRFLSNDDYMMPQSNALRDIIMLGGGGRQQNFNNPSYMSLREGKYQIRSGHHNNLRKILEKKVSTYDQCDANKAQT